MAYPDECTINVLANPYEMWAHAVIEFSDQHLGFRSNEQQSLT